MKRTLSPAQLEASKEIVVEYAIRMINWQGLRGTYREDETCNLAFYFTVMEIDLFYPKDMTVFEREYLAKHLVDEFISGRLEKRQQAELGITQPNPPGASVNLNFPRNEVDQHVMRLVKRVVGKARTPDRTEDYLVAEGSMPQFSRRN